MACDIRISLRALMAAALGMLAGCGGNDGAPGTRQSIRHVFVITLENKSYHTTFVDGSQSPYLSKTLPALGAHLSHYYGTGHNSLDNYIAMLSGQASSLQTQDDCPYYNDFKLTGMAPDGQAIGTGCVYPASIKTLADQLGDAKLSWKGYMEDMGNDPSREGATCGHPPLNGPDNTHSAQAPSAAVPRGDQYATRHNPFMYFHSLIDAPDCHAKVVNLDQLEADLAVPARTPNFAFITPNLCHDGHDGDGTGAPGKGCVNGEPGGLTSADAFLKTWVPRIMASAAYRQGGLLIINFDESELDEPTSVVDPATGFTTYTVVSPGESCCNQQTGPNVTRPYSVTYPMSASAAYTTIRTGVGGDRTGAVLLSPFIKPGTVSNVPYNHYSLLKSLENIFQLGYLGYAGQAGLVPFGSDIFNNL